MTPKSVTAAVFLALSSLAVSLTPAEAAATCLIQTTGVSFGNYNVYTVSSLLSNGNVKYDCTGYSSGSDTVTVTLSKGNSSTFNPRYMLNGTNQLDYNLYLNAGLTMIWGDGTGGTSIYGPTAAVNNTVYNVTIYGQVSAGQDAALGSYADSITATLNF